MIPIPPEARVELHLHTNMSKMDATTDVSDAIRRAAEWGHGAVAITDHGCVYAFPEAERAARKFGVKIIYGMEGYLQSEDEAYRYHHIVLLAKSRAGLKNLYKLVSLSHLHHYDRVPLIPRPELTAHREGLIVGSACEAGELFRAVENGKPWEELQRIVSFYDYLEIQPLCNNAFLLRNGTAQSEEQLRKFNRTIVRLGEETDTPVCATGDVHFLDPADEPSRRVLLHTRHCDDFNAPLPLYYRSTEDMLEAFAYLGADKAYEVVVTNTRAIADRVEEFPLFPEGLHLPTIPGGEEALRQAVAEQCRYLYGDTPPREIGSRLAAEWDAILPHGYAVIFEIARRLVQRSRENGYPVGFRGSVGSSLVAYLAGITTVNPLPPHYRCIRCKRVKFDSSGDYGCGADLPHKICPHCGEGMAKDGFDIPMETFFGLNGESVPDIDLTFAEEYLPQAHRHLAELFGTDHILYAGFANTCGNTVAQILLKSCERDTGSTFGKEQRKQIIAQLSNVRRWTGRQPGGLMIVPAGMEAEDFVPIRLAEDEGCPPTSHFASYDLVAHLLKMDLLGHSSPNMLALLRGFAGAELERIPMDDPVTLAHLFHEDPDIPDFHTEDAARILSAIQPSSFADLIRANALLHGTDVWAGNGEELLKSGTAMPREIVASRDDIFLYLLRKGLSRTRAYQIMDAVRMGKVKRGSAPDWPRWAEEMRSHGVPEWYIESLAKISYLFPKAHVVEYMQSSFCLAWYKMHRPIVFYAALLTYPAQHEWHTDAATWATFSNEPLDLLWPLKSVEELRAMIRFHEEWQEAQGGDLDSDTERLLYLIEAVCDAKDHGVRFLPPDLARSHTVDYLPTEEGVLLPAARMTQ